MIGLMIGALSGGLEYMLLRRMLLSITSKDGKKGKLPLYVLLKLGIAAAALLGSAFISVTDLLFCAGGLVAVNLGMSVVAFIGARRRMKGVE